MVRPSSNNELATRITSALVLAPVVTFFAWLGGIYFAALMALIGVLMYWEWTVMTQRRIEIHRDALALVLCLAFIGATYLFDTAIPSLLSFCLIAAGWFFVQKMKANIGWTIAGIGLGASLACCLIFIRHVDAIGFSLLVLLCFCVWAADSFAYVTGRLLGGPKLMPSVSPKKTWSGFTGGVLGAGLVGVLVSYALFGGAGFTHALFAMFLALAAQIGDLAESRIKRLVNVKDSSQLIPGHGGVLDRVDGLTLSAFVFTATYVLGLFKFDG